MRNHNGLKGNGKFLIFKSRLVCREKCLSIKGASLGSTLNSKLFPSRFIPVLIFIRNGLQRFALPSVGGFGNRLPGGNDDKKCDDEIIELFVRKSHAPNHCCHFAAADVTTVSPQLRKCIVGCCKTIFLFDSNVLQ